MGGARKQDDRRLGWLWTKLGRPAAVSIDDADGELVIVVQGYDETLSSGAILEAAQWSEADEALLRHHLVVAADQVAVVTALAAQDDYHPDTTGIVPSEPVVAPSGSALVTLSRPQLLDALHCSQERSRMAGLAQRHGGYVHGWDALQPRRASLPS